MTAHDPTTTRDTKHTPPGIDPRGPRFGAALTALLLAVTLLAGTSTVATVLLAIAVLGFLVGVVRGPSHTLQGWIFRTVVRPRIGPPEELEDPRPPRFAQGVGLVVTATGLVLGLLGLSAAIPVAAAVAFVAAFLNAAFDLCLGCEMYLLIQRASRR